MGAGGEGWEYDGGGGRVDKRQAISWRAGCIGADKNDYSGRGARIQDRLRGSCSETRPVAEEARTDIQQGGLYSPADNANAAEAVSAKFQNWHQGGDHAEAAKYGA